MENLVNILDSFQSGWKERKSDARGMDYLEGTSNIQKMIIARELLRIYYKEKIV